jgi:hypothetical protein
MVADPPFDFLIKTLYLPEDKISTLHNLEFSGQYQYGAYTTLHDFKAAPHCSGDQSGIISL